jgi:predicted enzyme related to lactoylglutathione lyase
MSERDSYPAGVPCWVETLQEDPEGAAAFYGSLLGWEIVGSGSAAETETFQYLVARRRGRDVAGIASLPEPGDGLLPSWVTHVRVGSADATSESARAAGGAVLDGPFDASPAGRLAVLADPTGALFCAWQADIREGAQLINEPGAWAMSALQTTDPARAADFYRSVFGWEAEPFGPVHLLRLPGYVGGTPDQPVPRDVVAVMAPLADADADARSRWDVDFWVQDAETTAEHAAELGGRVVVPLHERPPFRSAVLADPGGAAFSISQLVTGP